MIADFVARFDAARTSLRSGLFEKPPDGYADLVRRVVSALASEDGPSPDPTRITMIDHGHYQGTHVVVVGETGYQPSRYWYALISYGSCSVCDAFQAAVERMPCTEDCSARVMSDDVASQLMALMLHIVQGMRPMDGPFS